MPDLVPKKGIILYSNIYGIASLAKTTSIIPMTEFVSDGKSIEALKARYNLIHRS